MNNSPTPSPTEQDGRWPPADLLRALADDRRRTTLSVLLDASTPIDARLVARRVVARETERDVSRISSERVDRVHVSLHHVHLPKLSDVGLASYDPDTGLVEDAVEDAESIPL